MSQLEKAKHRLLSRPCDYTYAESKNLLQKLGFLEKTKGKTSGSRVCFFRQSDNKILLLHKPHPQNVLRSYVVDYLVDELRSSGDLK